MNIELIFSALAFALGIFVSIYLFVTWLLSRCVKTPFLFWSLALFFIYWFQVPIILTNLGRVITVTNFNLFFALTFPITFLALVLIYLGFINVLRFRLKKKIKIVLGLWFLSSIIFFGYHFIIHAGIIETYSLPLVGNIIFYLPIRMLIILAAIRWFSHPSPKNFFMTLGVISVAGESILGITRNFLVIKNVLAYPPEFWYVVLSSLDIFFILQTASIFLLAFGFFLLRHTCYQEESDA